MYIDRFGRDESRPLAIKAKLAVIHDITGIGQSHMATQIPSCRAGVKLHNIQLYVTNVRLDLSGYEASFTTLSMKALRHATICLATRCFGEHFCFFFFFFSSCKPAPNPFYRRLGFGEHKLRLDSSRSPPSGISVEILYNDARPRPGFLNIRDGSLHLDLGFISTQAGCHHATSIYKSHTTAR